MSLVSKCCDAKPFFSLGVAHGVKLTDKGTFVGVCSDCKKDCKFKDKGK